MLRHRCIRNFTVFGFARRPLVTLPVTATKKTVVTSLVLSTPEAESTGGDDPLPLRIAVGVIACDNRLNRNYLFPLYLKYF